MKALKKELENRIEEVGLKSREKSENDFLYAISVPVNGKGEFY